MVDIAVLRQAFEASMESDATTRTNGEKHLESTRQHAGILPAVITLTMQLQNELQADLGDTQRRETLRTNLDAASMLRKKFGLLQLVVVYLKNRVEKSWGFKPKTREQYSAEDMTQVLQMLLPLVHATYLFVTRYCSSDFSEACSQSQQLHGVVSTTTITSPTNGGLSVSKDTSAVKTFNSAVRIGFLLLKQLQVIVKVISKRDVPGPLESVLRLQTMPLLAFFGDANAQTQQACVAGVPNFDASAPNPLDQVQQMLTQGATSEQIDLALKQNSNVAWLYASLMVLRVTVQNQEYARMRDPQPLNALCSTMFPHVEKVGVKLCDILAKVAEHDARNPGVPKSGSLWHDRFFDLQRLVLKTYVHSIATDSNDYIKDKIAVWMEITGKMIDVNVPDKYVELLPVKKNHQKPYRGFYIY